MHYCIQKLTLKLYDKDRTEHGHLTFNFDPVGMPPNFYEQAPHISLSGTDSETVFIEL